MQTMKPLRAARGVVAVALLAGGCQTYRAQPVDLAAHRELVSARGVETEAVSAFLERLRAEGCVAPGRFDLGDGVTAAEGEALALVFHPGLRLARARAGVTRASAENAGLWEDPVLGFDGAEVLSPGSLFEFGVTLGLTLPVSGRLEAERALAGAEHEAALRRVVDAEWGVRREVRRAWAVLDAARAREELQRELVERLSELAGVTSRLESAGELSRVEGRVFLAELAARRSELIGAGLEAARARAALLELMGLSPDAGVELVGRGLAPAAAAGGDAVARLIASNTELAALRAEHESAERAVRAELRGQYPDVTIGGGYGSEDRDDRLLLGVSVPIPALNGNRGGIARARAEREVTRAAAETAFERLAHRLATARVELSAASAQRAAYETEIGPLMAEQDEETRRLAELGDVNTLLLLDTLTRSHEVKARAVGLRLEEELASVEIAWLLGPEPGDEDDGAPDGAGGVR